MTTKLEMIEMLRERTNATYEEAKEALDRCDGDMVEALIYLERNQKTRRASSQGPQQGSSLGKWLSGIIRKGNRTKFVISKDENSILRIPVTLLIIITVFAPYLTLIGAVVALFTEHSFRFIKEDGSNAEINKMLVRVSSAVDAAKVKLTEDRPLDL
jgi:hypothetical protein